MKNGPQTVWIALALLAGIAGFSVFKYASSVKENYDLAADVEQLSIEILGLEEEKNALSSTLEREKKIQQALAAEHALTQGVLQEFKQKLGVLETELQFSQMAVEELGEQLSAVKAENLALRDQAQTLQLEVAQARQDNQSMKQQLASVKELKKAIRGLRRSVRAARHTAVLRLEKEELLVGNAGFLVKDGKSTYPSRIKIDVSPVSAGGAQ